MIIIDGAGGEGGGQVVRNALALSLVTGQPFRITDIRGGRDKPGLMRQHLTAVEAALTIGGSMCEGASVGSTEIAFTPGQVTPGEYHFAVGTAGSTSLVFQTVLMPLLLADGPSRLVLEGGTHNMMAPPFDFIERAFLPVINRMGPQVSARLTRHGFFPRGGGRIEVDIMPGTLSPIECVDRGALQSVSATALFAALPFGIAEREIKAAHRLLPDWPEEAFSVRELPEDQGPGTALLLRQCSSMPPRSSPALASSGSRRNRWPRPRRIAWPASSRPTHLRGRIWRTSCCCRLRWQVAAASQP